MTRETNGPNRHLDQQRTSTRQQDEPRRADDTLPVPVSDTDPKRTYIVVTPSTDTLSPGAAVQQFRRLHSLGSEHAGGLLSSLRGRGTRPTVECLLIATGRDTDPLTYAFGVDDADALPLLEQSLRALFPETYTLTRGTAPADRLDRLFGDQADTTHPDRLAAIEFHATVNHHRDWQTTLQPFAAWYGNDTRGRRWSSERTQESTDDDATTATLPLTAVVETMATASVPMVYQTLIQPYPDWTGARDDRKESITSHMDTVIDQVVDVVVGSPDDVADVELSLSEQERLDDLQRRDPHHSFVVTARLLAGTPQEHTAAQNDAERDGSTTTGDRDTDTSTRDDAVRTLRSVFAAVSGTTHRLAATKRTGAAASAVRDRLLARTPATPTYEQLRNRLRGSIRSHGIVADAHEVGSFCMLDGGRLSSAGRRALAPTPPDRTPLARPPEGQLTPYRGPGLQLGYPRRADGQRDAQPVTVPLSLLALHVAIFGQTGAGKSMALLSGLRTLVDAKAQDVSTTGTAASDATPPGGATIALLPKGDRMGAEYCRAHFLETGSLDDVAYYDCAEWLPALTFFDIRQDLAAGVPRTTAVEDRLAHYVELLRALVGPDQYDRAVRSPDIITYLVKALFDPVHGHDAFPHRALRAAARDLLNGTVPPVSDQDLEASLAGVASNRREELSKLVHGVLNRIEKIPVDERLGRMLNHVVSDDRVRGGEATATPTTSDPAAATATASDSDANSKSEADLDPHFDFGPLLDQDTVVLFDMGRLRPASQEALAIVLLSNLWSALRRRRRRAPPATDLPLVNVVVEEAAAVAGTDLVSELLAQARGFGASMTLAMQFPAQLADRNERAYREVLNNVGTVLTGTVAVDRRLAERLATSDVPADAVQHRLRALSRGEWLVSLPAPFDKPTPQPFVVESAPLPAGHPDGPRPLTDADAEQFAAAFAQCCSRTRETAGLELEAPETVASDHGEGSRRDGDARTDAPDATGDDSAHPVRFDSALPYTTRLPRQVWYDEESHALRCAFCDNRYDPTSTGMRRALTCCGSLDDVDRDDVPICELNVKLTSDELAELPWRPAQIRLLQACYHASQGQYDPLAYDIQRDSMLRLQEYVGADNDDVAELVEADLLRSTDHPHRLYTVTPAGRDVLGEGYRQGVDFGDGKGDLEESAEHVLGVRVGERLLEEVFVADPDCPATTVKPYHEIDEQRRLDIAALNDAGDVVVAIEVERVNHDVRRAAPADFDKMVDCGAQEAIWIVMTQRDGHTVLQALNDPLEGKPRVQKTYAETTPPQQFRIDTPGLTAMYPVAWLRKRLDDPEWEWDRLGDREWE